MNVPVNINTQALALKAKDNKRTQKFPRMKLSTLYRISEYPCCPQSTIIELPSPISVGVVQEISHYLDADFSILNALLGVMRGTVTRHWL